MEESILYVVDSLISKYFISSGRRFNTEASSCTTNVESDNFMASKVDPPFITRKLLSTCC